jgi:hypothetical protein
MLQKSAPLDALFFGLAGARLTQAYRCAKTLSYGGG